eukprot:GFUD01124077.1.p1 GENE.GFUD01124077.1~~GFUD01124077.1.p1  ORF type:complete len:113 (-),score=29.20 GFUD01124077.1:242-580(-)
MKPRTSQNQRIKLKIPGKQKILNLFMYEVVLDPPMKKVVPKFEAVPRVERIVKATKEQEALAEALPDIPEDEAESPNPIDDQIQARLLSLKFFRHTWPKNTTLSDVIAPTTD